MKKLMFVLVAIALIASVASSQWGQGKMSWGAGAEVALPMSTWGDAVGMGLGGFGLFQYGVTPEILLTGQVGYTMWMEKEVYDVKSSASAMTFIVGAKYNLSAQVTPGFYGLLQIGIYSLTQKVETPAYNYGWITIPASSYESTSSETVLLPGVGYQFDSFDISVKYTLKGNFNNLCLNIAYVMPL